MKCLVTVLAFFTLITTSRCSGGCLIDIDSRVDQSIEKANARNLEEGHTYLENERGHVENLLTFEGMTVLGLDSMMRTDHCTVFITPERSTYELHIGFRFLHFFFKRLDLDKKSFSATFKVEANSIVLGFTLRNETQNTCNVKVDKLYIKDLWGMNLFTADPNYTNVPLNDFFKDNVIPHFNSDLDKHKPFVETVLSYKYCGNSQHPAPTDPNGDNVLAAVLIALIESLVF